MDEEMSSLSHWPPPYWPKKNGKKAHRSQGYRLFREGIAGVRLKAIWLHGAWWTNRRLVEEFVLEVTKAKTRTMAKSPISDIADAVLACAGIIEKKEGT